MYTLIVDHWISRRKRTNHVLDDNDQLVFTASDLMSCFEFLLEMGQDYFKAFQVHDTAVHIRLYQDDDKPPPSQTSCPDDPL